MQKQSTSVWLAIFVNRDSIKVSSLSPCCKATVTRVKTRKQGCFSGDGFDNEDKHDFFTVTRGIVLSRCLAEITNWATCLSQSDVLDVRRRFEKIKLNPREDASSSVCFETCSDDGL